MFHELPQFIQQQILYFLESNNFIAAKKLRDEYIMTQFYNDA